MKGKWWVLGALLLAITGGMSMSAFGFLGFGNSKSWKEEVLLHDGRKIVAERSQIRGRPPTLDSREGRILDETLAFTHPGTGKKVVWSMSFRDDAPEPNGVAIMLLEIVDNVPYIAGWLAGCIAYNKWQRPNPPQILYRYEAERWKRISLEEFPRQLVKGNVIGGSPPAKGIKTLYTVEQVNEMNHDIRTPEFIGILREPVKPGTVEGSNVNCPDFSSPRYTSPKAPLPMSSSESGASAK